MPLVTIYVSSNKIADNIKKVLLPLREFIANKLTCENRIIKPDEISIQLMVPSAQLSIADVEVIINAYSYSERVKNQDKICLEIKNFILSQEHISKKVFVWLQLGELGHSAEE